VLGITFFNYVNINFTNHINYFPEISIWRIYTENDYNTIIFILKHFFNDLKSIDKEIDINWKKFFIEKFNEIINENYFNVYIDKNIPLEFYKFKNLNELINFLENND
jgi:hypothetical protein